MRNKGISLAGILMAIYFAIFPIHQSLLLSNGDTVTKYLSFVVMIVVILSGSFKMNSERCK